MQLSPWFSSAFLKWTSQHQKPPSYNLHSQEGKQFLFQLVLSFFFSSSYQQCKSKDPGYKQLINNPTQVFWLISWDNNLLPSILSLPGFSDTFKHTASFNMLKKKSTREWEQKISPPHTIAVGNLSASWKSVTYGTWQEDIYISYYSFTLISKQ